MSPQPEPATVRQRVTWEDASCGVLEILSETFERTTEYCLACETPSRWVNADGSRRVCSRCASVQCTDEAPEAATDFWLTIIRQLQLAEASR